MGSMHEVGYWEGAIDENTPCNPLSQYGIAKNALRQSLMLTVAGTPCALHWLRAYYITGDDRAQQQHFLKNWFRPPGMGKRSSRSRQERISMISLTLRTWQP